MKYRVILLAAVLTLSLLPSALSAELPDMSDISCSGPSGYTYRFAAETFIGSVSDGSRLLEGIVIVTLPQTGTLAFAGRALMEGEAIPTALLDSLSYVPGSTSPGDVSFSILPVFEDHVGDGTTRVSVSLTRRENRPPIAENMEIKTYRNIAATGTFRVTDPEGDALTYRITSKPKRGDVEILDDGRFVYTPYHNKSGSDSLTYVAVDSFGNTSAQAQITIRIQKQSTKTTYADMDGHPSYYAALRLTEAGVLTGQMMCGSYYFHPEQTLSRAELITMVMKVVGMDSPAEAVATGFFDDADMPAWFKPYAQAALKAGIISGSETADGRKYVNAAAPAKLSEAVALINNALRIANVSSDEMDEAVPVWAAQAVVNMKAVGIMRGLESNAAWNEPITRADAAILLCNALDVYESTKPKGGLLSWVFGW